MGTWKKLHQKFPPELAFVCKLNKKRNMKKFILILGLLLCYATIAGTSQTKKVWVVNSKNIPLVSPAKTLVEHLAEPLLNPQ